MHGSEKEETMKNKALDLTFVRIANNKKFTSALRKLMKDAEEKGGADGNTRYPADERGRA